MSQMNGEIYPEWLRGIKARLGQFVLDMIGARFMQEPEEEARSETAFDSYC